MMKEPIELPREYEERWKNTRQSSKTGDLVVMWCTSSTCNSFIHTRIHLFQKRLVKVLLGILHLVYQARNALWAMWMESAKGHNNMDSGNFPKLCLRNMDGASIFSSVCACWHYLFTYDPQYISGLVCNMQDATKPSPTFFEIAVYQWIFVSSSHPLLSQFWLFILKAFAIAIVQTLWRNIFNFVTTSGKDLNLIHWNVCKYLHIDVTDCAYACGGPVHFEVRAFVLALDPFFQS